MRSLDSATTRLDDYIVDMLPWAHGHQRKAIRDFVQAIIDQQTGCQAQLARSFGNQEAATKRLFNSRLMVQSGWPSTGPSKGSSTCWSSR